jgi:adenosylcobyric acid synthase
MLGERIEDPCGAEGPPGAVDGLGWLPLWTSFEADKVLDRPAARVIAEPGAGCWVRGYRIHHGRMTLAPWPDAGGSESTSNRRHSESTSNRRHVEPWLVAADGTELGWRGGPGGLVCATALHGLFEDDGFRGAFLDWLARRRGGPAPVPSVAGMSFAAARAARFDRIADALEAHVDLDRLFDLMGLAGDARAAGPADPGGRRR